MMVMMMVVVMSFPCKFSNVVFTIAARTHIRYTFITGLAVELEISYLTTGVDIFVIVVLILIQRIFESLLKGTCRACRAVGVQVATMPLIGICSHVLGGRCSGSSTH